jgi:hypothetical protein
MGKRVGKKKKFDYASHERTVGMDQKYTVWMAVIGLVLIAAIVIVYLL